MKLKTLIKKLRKLGGEQDSPPIFMTGPHKPAALSGLCVLDLSRILAGPTATQIPADLGAVVRLERGRINEVMGEAIALALSGHPDPCTLMCRSMWLSWNPMASGCFTVIAIHIPNRAYDGHI